MSGPMENEDPDDFINAKNEPTGCPIKDRFNAHKSIHKGHILCPKYTNNMLMYSVQPSMWAFLSLVKGILPFWRSKIKAAQEIPMNFII
jgi:hypothetical protein